MINYYKSTGGYYYKETKNNKTRISEELYNKIKMNGGTLGYNNVSPEQTSVPRNIHGNIIFSTIEKDYMNLSLNHASNINTPFQISKYEWTPAIIRTIILYIYTRVDNNRPICVYDYANLINIHKQNNRTSTQKINYLAIEYMISMSTDLHIVIHKCHPRDNGDMCKWDNRYCRIFWSSNNILVVLLNQNGVKNIDDIISSILALKLSKENTNIKYITHDQNKFELGEPRKNKDAGDNYQYKDLKQLLIDIDIINNKIRAGNLNNVLKSKLDKLKESEDHGMVWRNILLLNNKKTFINEHRSRLKSSQRLASRRFTNNTSTNSHDRLTQHYTNKFNEIDSTILEEITYGSEINFDGISALIYQSFNNKNLIDQPIIYLSYRNKYSKSIKFNELSTRLSTNDLIKSLFSQYEWFFYQLTIAPPYCFGITFYSFRRPELLQETRFKEEFRNSRQKILAINDSIPPNKKEEIKMFMNNYIKSIIAIWMINNKNF